MNSALKAIEQEQGYQLEQWGEQNHPNGTGDPIHRRDAEHWKAVNSKAVRNCSLTWRLILQEEVSEAFAESDPEKLKEELIQVAAVAASWIEAIERANK